MDSLTKFWSGRMEETNGCKIMYFSLGAFVAVGVASIGYKTLQSKLQQRKLNGLITLKRKQRENQINGLRSHLQRASKDVESRRNQIVDFSFEELRSKLQNGQLTAIEALEAFQWRALHAHERTNCVCEFLLEATDWAKKLDQEYANHNDKKPPLFGVPISVKECNRLIGHDCTTGFAQFIGRVSEEDAALVAVLKAMGAVPFVTTNLPQSMISIGSSNPVFGLTTNPYDQDRSPGGSSSGEGALIALHGSPLGVGTDVGGSVRVPAHWCGICSLKPSVGRLAQGGRMGVVPGQTVVKGTAGPMGQDVDSLVWFMRAVCDNVMYSLDPYVVPRPFNDGLYLGDGRPLTIGYYTYDGWLQASPACRRAVDVARKILESNGHKLIEIALPFGPDEISQMVSDYFAALIPDGGENIDKVCASDIVDPLHTDLMALFGQPNWFRRLKSLLVSSRRVATITSAFSSNIVQQRVAISNIFSYRDRFIKFWRQHHLDAVVCPAVASTPVPSELAPKLFVVLWWACALYNLLDFSAGVVPCTHVTPEDEEETLKGEYVDKSDAKDWIVRAIRKHSKGTTGFPVGVQCVTLPFRDEVCLRVMKEIEAAVKGKGKLG